jgi:hypothetical protein
VDVLTVHESNAVRLACSHLTQVVGSQIFIQPRDALRHRWYSKSKCTVRSQTGLVLLRRHWFRDACDLVLDPDFVHMSAFIMWVLTDFSCTDTIDISMDGRPVQNIHLPVHEHNEPATSQGQYECAGTKNALTSCTVHGCPGVRYCNCSRDCWHWAHSSHAVHGYCPCLEESQPTGTITYRSQNEEICRSFIPVLEMVDSRATRLQRPVAANRVPFGSASSSRTLASVLEAGTTEEYKIIVDNHIQKNPASSSD